MFIRKIILLIGVLALLTLNACQSHLDVTSSQAAPAQATATPVPLAKPTATATATMTATATNKTATPVANASAPQRATHDDPKDYVWDNATVVPIILKGDTASANGTGVTVTGNRVTITAAGTYRLSGTLTDGQIIVDTEDKGVVRMILNGVDLHNSTGAPICVMNAKKTVVILADNTQNVLSDGASYVFADPATDEPNAALFSKSDLTIYGNGSLTVNGNYNDGIASKDGLVIASGNLTVQAVDDGIRGKDYLVIKGGKITVTAQGDGLKSDNAEDATRGYLSITAGVIAVTAGGDAIEAQTDILITGGEFVLTAGGGSKNRSNADTSMKGIKAAVNVQITGGNFIINAADDAINSNSNLLINGGTFTIATGDDGMHANATLTINNGNIDITDCYEGIESAVITINAGDIRIVASDDGINVAGGNDGSGMNPGMRPGMGAGGRMPPAGAGPGQDTFNYTGKYYLYVNGGHIVVTAIGDGVDVNGAIEMTNGTIIVNGPTQQMNSALDYDAGFKMTGGFLVAAGSVGMAQAPDASSSQYSVLINLNSVLPAGTLMRIQDSKGNNVLTFSPTKPYQSIAFSSPELVKGTTYDVYVGGSITGTPQDGLYTAGSYTPGSKYTSLTLTSTATRVGSSRLR